MLRVDLSGTTALVTGSTRGIGYEVARQLGLCGAHVIINGRIPDKQAGPPCPNRRAGALRSPASAGLSRNHGHGGKDHR